VNVLRPFSLLIKPASADCNLSCDYCFYSNRFSLYPCNREHRHRMAYATVVQLIRGYLNTDQPEYVFCWQGGEPTLMGEKFFQKVMKLQLKHRRKHSIITNALQTNATLLTDSFAKFLAKYNFLVGISLDGPPAIHDRYRRYKKKHGSHADAMRGIGYLTKYRADFNILTLVSSANVHKGRQLYTYLRDLGFCYHQYIPCVEFDKKGSLLPFGITAEQWGDFLCQIFDEWYAHDTRSVSIRLFDSIINYLVMNIKTVCQMSEDCCQYFVVEFNGDVYPCDFFVEPALNLGNINTTSWDQLIQSKTYINFGDQKSRRHATCESCNHLPYCAGDCLKHRFYRSKNPADLSWLCQGLKSFYDHALPGFTKLAQQIKNRNPQNSLSII